METVLKLLAGAVILGGVYFWFMGYIKEKGDEAAAPTELAAAPVLAFPQEGGFEETGTIVLDTSNGLPAKPYLLYTTYSEGGKPSVRTKRLVLLYQDVCAQKDLPCATGQPAAPLQAEEKVRVVGTVKDDTVEVTELYRVS